MGKPVHRAKIKAGMRAGKAAGRILDAQIANVREHAPAALLGEVEGIHDLRVSIKRLRETLRLFRKLLPTRRRQVAMQLVELLNDSLGEVREPDVLCLDAAELGREMEDDGGLLEIATAAWQTEREAAFERLLTLWSHLESEGLFDGLEEIARRTRRRRRKANRLDLEHFAYDAIRRAMRRVEDRLGPALDSEEPAPLHRLRIAIKRLRYGMEPFRPILPGLRAPWKLVSDAQELLGLAHDLDVMRDRLSEHIGELHEDRRHAGEKLLSLLDERRGERYSQSRQVIALFAGSEFRQTVLDAID